MVLELLTIDHKSTTILLIVLPDDTLTKFHVRNQVDRRDEKAIGKQRDQVAKHVAGGRKAVQQQYHWRIACPRLAVEHFNITNLSKPVAHFDRTILFFDFLPTELRRSDLESWTPFAYPTIAAPNPREPPVTSATLPASIIVSHCRSTTALHTRHLPSTFHLLRTMPGQMIKTGLHLQLQEVFQPVRSGEVLSSKLWLHPTHL